ncbi:MAG TPA: hypothetical protein VL549_14555 [Gemmatimonadales bacterium]|jgi:cytochrome c5|nr:hypothetical protein [Gemmatimonadales bacterium]
MRVLVIALLLAGCQPATPQEKAPVGNRASGLSRQDELVLAAANVALPPPGIVASDLPDPSSPGAKIVANYCAQCHNLPTPQMHSATDWPSVARRMWLRMDLLPPSLGIKVPTMGDRFTLLGYLTTNALKVSGASLPAGPGREAFAETCSRCHALPDPRVHSRADWPTVFARMEQNMTRMQVPPPTREQTSDLLLYLQTVASRQ